MRKGIALAVAATSLCLQPSSRADEEASRTVLLKDVPAVCVAVSADGERVAAGDEAGCVRVLDAKTGEETARLDTGDRSVRDIGFAGPNATTLVTSGHDVCVWNVAKGTVVRRIGVPAKLSAEDAKNATYLAAAASWRDRLLAVALPDRRVLFWNVATDRDAGSVAVEGWAVDAAFSSDGSKFALLAWRPAGGSVLQVLDVARRTCVWKDLPSEDDDPGSRLVRWEKVTFSPDGTQLLATSHEESADWPSLSGIRVYDLARKKRRWTRRLEGVGVRDVAWSPRGDRIALATSKGLQFLDPATGASVAGPQDPDGRDDVEFAPDGRSLYAANWDGRRLVRWDLPDAAPDSAAGPSATGGAEPIPLVRTPVAFKESVATMAVSPDGRTLVTSETRDPIGADGRGRIRVYDLQSGALRREFEADKEPPDRMSFVGGDSDLLLTLPDFGRAASVWSVSTGIRRTLFDDHLVRPVGTTAPWRLVSVAACRTRREFVAAFLPPDGTPQPARICTVDPASGRILATLPDAHAFLEEQREPVLLAYSSDGLQLAALFHDSTPIVVVFRRRDATAPWERGDPIRHQDVGELPPSVRPLWRELTFSADGRFVLVRADVRVGERDLRSVVAAWDPAARTGVWAGATARNNYADGMAIAPSAPLLAISTITGAALLDVATGRQLRTLPGTRSIPVAIAYSADGRRLFAAVDGTLVAWDVAGVK